MKKKTTKKKELSYKDYIIDVCGELRGKFFMQEWTMFYEFSDENIGTKDDTRAAEININQTYIRFTLTMYPIIKRFHKKKNHTDIIDILIHEFCHVLTEPLYTFAINAATNQTGPILEDTREMQTERIANIIRSSLGKKFYDQFKIK